MGGAEEVLDFLAQGGALRMLANIDEAQLQTLYAFACQKVKLGDLATAESLFHALFSLDAWNFNYALSLGLCQQKRSAHEEALLCFARAGTLKITDPRPAYYAALSYQKLGDVVHAKKAFSAALRWASNRSEYQTLRQQAEIALAELPPVENSAENWGLNMVGRTDKAAS